MKTTNKKALSRTQLKNITGSGEEITCAKECCAGKPLCPNLGFQCLDVVCPELS